MTKHGEHDIPRDEIADRVLDRLVSALPADDEEPGDRAMVARSIERIVAQRAGAQSAGRIVQELAWPRRWLPLAAAATLLVAAAAMAYLGRSQQPAPPPEPPRVGDEPSGLTVSTPAPSVNPPPGAAGDMPTFDVSSLPTAPSASARAPARTVEAVTAAELFAQANEARRKRDVAGARALYLELQARYPRSAEASTSYVTLGRLELDHGRSSAALAQYDRYLASGSTELREDALAGRASALESLGRGEEEKRAWQALLAAYPTSLFAPHARQRLSALP